MHKTSAEARSFLAAFMPLLPEFSSDIEIIIAAPFTALAAMRAELGHDSRILLAAQNVNSHPFGAYTGEISLPMLAEFGVTHVILGHSERRMIFGETDASVNEKTRAVLAAKMTPIIAMGETREERDAGLTHERVMSQARAALAGLSPTDVARTILAYEPIWAIGTGLNCAVADADAAMAAIRNAVDGLASVPILYGGSMKPDNVKTYLGAPQIAGGLIGGASLDVASFAEMLRNAV